MEREAIRQSQKDCGDTTKKAPSGPSLTSTHAEAVGETPLPILPRLTPNPTLSSPILTPSSTSPPPPLTLAPLLTASHTLKTGTPSPLQHSLLPTPPKLTSTLSPNLRTYSRPIIPSPKGKNKISPGAKPAPLISTAPTHTPSSTSPTEASIPSASSVTYGNLTPSLKTSAAVANGNARPTSVPTSTPITPFHTPASPTGRQVPNKHPFASPGHNQVSQSSSNVTQRISQQALLLGRDLKGSSHDQLQSLTLRPPPPGTLTIPPSLRLKLPSSAPPPLSRPRTPLFPPIRPRPQPSAVASSSHTTPTRHLSVPPPTLYSAVRAVPLRPRLHSPNGHRAMSPRQSASLRPITATPARQMGPINRQFAGLKNPHSSQPAPPPGQSQPNSVSIGHPSCFEQSPSAARQLQIIALTSGRQSQLGNSSHTPTSVQSMCSTAESPTPQLNERSPPTQSPEVKPPLCPVSPPKTSPPLLSSPALLYPSSPQPRTSHSTHNTQQPGDREDHKLNERMTEDKVKVQGNGGPDKKKGGTTAQTENQKEAKNMKDESRMVLGVTERHREEEMDQKSDEEEIMEGTEKDQATQKEARVQEGNSMDQSECQPAPVDYFHKTNLSLNRDPASFPKVAVNTPNAKLSDKPTELSSMSKDDLCENMSAQSDNQSVLSSLSSQSPPTSPLNNSLSISLPLSLPAQSFPADSPWPCEPEKNDKLEVVPNLDKFDEESVSLSQSHHGPWAQKVWPGGGKQVLTHLVEGFVIQEGLQPFPVLNRSSLLMQDQVNRSQGTNGINGTDVSPLKVSVEESEPQMDSEEHTSNDQMTAETGEREAPVLHCQFCGKRGHVHNFMRSKRFCSTACARGFNVRLTKRLRALSAGSRPERRNTALNRTESVPGKPLLLRLPRELWSAGRRSDAQEGLLYSVTNRERRKAARRARRASEPAMTVSSPTLTSLPGPAQWSVEEVTSFIHTLPGGRQVAEEFRLQEIDGQALLLLTEDHLMTSMNIKLGPALKICAHINALKHH